MYIDFIKKSAQAGYIMGLLLAPKQVRNQILFFFFFNVQVSCILNCLFFSKG